MAFHKRSAKNVNRPEYYKNQMDKALAKNNNKKYNKAKKNLTFSSNFYKSYNKYMNEGEKETKKLIKKLESKGFKTISKNTYRNAMYYSEAAVLGGASFIGHLLGLPHQAVSASIGATIGNNNLVKGTKYIVKRDLDREAKEMAENSIDDFVEVWNGNMSKEDFNEKYKGTGYKIN